MSKDTNDKNNEVKTLAKTAKALNKERAREINKLYDKLYGLMKKGSLIAFEIGELVYGAYGDLTKQDFDNWIEQNLTMSKQTALNYKKLYECFYNNPERLNDLTIMEAYAEAGITNRKELPAPEEGKLITYGADEDDLIDDEELRTVFKRKTISGVKLENYRVEAYQGELWGFRKGYGRFPVADLRIIKPAGLPEIEWDEMHRNVQIAFESYFAKLEEYEKNGAVQAPEDTRFGTLMKKKSEAAGKKTVNPFDDNGPFAVGDAGFTVEPNGLGNGFYPPSPMQGDVANSEITKAVRKAAKK